MADLVATLGDNSCRSAAGRIAACRAADGGRLHPAFPDVADHWVGITRVMGGRRPKEECLRWRLWHSSHDDRGSACSLLLMEICRRHIRIGGRVVSETSDRDVVVGLSPARCLACDATDGFDVLLSREMVVGTLETFSVPSLSCRAAASAERTIRVRGPCRLLLR